MKSLPTIHVIEFAGADTSYRIPLYRARNYWEFLERLHDTFEKPWELHNAHLHFDDKFCHSRISQSEWNAGGYFAPEFTRDGRLVLYAHFERLETRVRAESTDVQASIDEQWHWGWHGDGGSKDKWYSRPGQDEAMEELKHDPYPTFPERLPLDDPVYKIKLDQSESNIAAASLPALQPPSARSDDTLVADQTIFPRPDDFAVIDDTDSRKHRKNGIIIGHAKPCCCRDPKKRPAARAIIAQGGRVVASVVAKYTFSDSKGSVLIPLEDIDFVARFNSFSFGEERRQAIVDALLEKNDIKREQESSVHSSLLTDRIMQEGVVIGHAKPERSRDPANPPTVRAMLNSVGAVMCFIEAKESRKGHTKGMAQIHVRDVDYTADLAAVAVSKRGKAIKAMILGKRGTGTREGELKVEVVE